MVRAFRMPERNAMNVYIPAKVRGPIYAGYAVVGTALGATQVGFASANTTQPAWLTVALSVFAFLGGAIGYTAASNTPAAPSERTVYRDESGRAVGGPIVGPYSADTKADAAYHGLHEGQ